MDPGDTITARKMRGLELTSAWLGEGGEVLMERAGIGAADLIRASYPDLDPGKLAVVCGRGNNGGDGYVIARCIPGSSVFTIGEPTTPASRLNHELLENPTTLVPPVPDLSGFDVVVDAVFGTGIRGEVRSPARELLEAINASGADVVAVDVPSGVNPDTGKHGEVYVRAGRTITFHKRKKGMAGDVHVHPIFSPETLVTCGPGDVYALPVRARDAHKGDGGSVLVVGGSEDYAGAPALAGLAALRAGADLVYVAAPERVAWAINALTPDLITAKGLDEGRLKRLASRVDVILAGPGLTGEEAADAMDIILTSTDQTLVLDASALDHVAGREGVLGERDVVLTPHRGEFKRLAGTRADERSVASFSEHTGACVLLKGPEDLIVHGEQVKHNRTGNPGMTVGGTGDVLAGVTAAYLALCGNPFDAACAAAFTVGSAGDSAYEQRGDGLVASDLLAMIPYVIQECRQVPPIKMGGLQLDRGSA